MARQVAQSADYPVVVVLDDESKYFAGETVTLNGDGYLEVVVVTYDKVGHLIVAMTVTAAAS